MSSFSARPFIALLLLFGLCAASSAERATDNSDITRYRQWIAQMKEAERGPFTRIRWFCADGTVLAPGASACKEHGGGVQHGELSARVLEFRTAGYHLANVLADIDAKAFLAASEHRNTLAQILIEQFLIQVDNGWILRRARYYRGAFQEEDERRGGRDLLLALVASNSHLQRDYALLRTAVRALPHGAGNRSASLVRQLSADLSDRNNKFLQSRNKSHGQPDGGDAQRFVTLRQR